MPKINPHENKPKSPDTEWVNNPQNDRLIDAAFQGDIEYVSRLLESGSADVNHCVKEGNSILHVAILAKDLAMVKMLLKFRPNLEAKDNTKCSPTWLAALTGENEIVTALVEAGADVKERLNVYYDWEEMCSHKRGMTFLHLFVAQRNAALVRLLLDYGADVNAPDKDGVSPLHAALQVHSAEIAKILLDKGASVDSANSKGETVLQAAALFGNKEMISIILNHKPNLNATDILGKNALHYLTQSNEDNLEIAERLLKEGVFINQAEDHTGITPLHIAIITKKPELIKLYVEHGADANATIMSGYSALNLAGISCGAAIVRLLLKNGADPNSISDAGETTLHRACRQCAEDKIQILLEHGADVNIKGESGRTAIESLRFLDTAAAKVLIKHIIKMESLNLFIDESIMRFIQNNELLKQHRESCLLEVESMKSQKFYDKYSFYYIFLHNFEIFYKMTANEEFTENFNRFDVVSTYPWFGKDLEINFKKAEQRLRAYNKMIDHLGTVFYHRYDSILEHIVKYLKLSDLPFCST